MGYNSITVSGALAIAGALEINKTLTVVIIVI